MRPLRTLYASCREHWAHQQVGIEHLGELLGRRLEKRLLVHQPSVGDGSMQPPVLPDYLFHGLFRLCLVAHVQRVERRVRASVFVSDFCSSAASV
jgi:hypothetical protein